jgi:hypothetical protein
LSGDAIKALLIGKTVKLGTGVAPYSPDGAYEYCERLGNGPPFIGAPP